MGSYRKPGNLKTYWVPIENEKNRTWFFSMEKELCLSLGDHEKPQFMEM